MSNLAQNQNQFAQTALIGQVAIQPNIDTETCMINPSTSATVITAGQAVKLVAAASPNIVVDICASASDGPVYGILAYNPRKNSNYVAGGMVEVAGPGNIIHLKSSAAINRGVRVACTNQTVSTNDATVAGDTTVGDYTVGIALGQAAGANALLKIKVQPALNSSNGPLSVSP